MYLNGETDYAGSLLGSGNSYGSYQSTTANTIIDIDINYKKTYILNDFIDVYYLLGGGYKYWERGLSKQQIEIYEWYSLRTALGFTYKINKNISLGLGVEYQSSLFETMSASNLGVTFDLGSANIMQVGIPLVYRYSDTLDIFLEGVYEKQRIEESNVINNFYEPQSTAHNQYIKVGMSFKF